MSWLYLALSLAGAWAAYNAWRPTYAPGKSAVLSFLFGWLTAELALHHIVFQVVVTLLFAWGGAFHHWPGKLGLLIAICSWVSLWRVYWVADGAGVVVEQALSSGLGPDYRGVIHPQWSSKFPERIDWGPIVRTFPIRHPEVERVRGITYARLTGLNVKLDVYRHKSRPQRCPTLLQIHGGGWCVGSKNEQGLPLMVHMAARGWVCVSVDYRLSPHATFPDHLVDVKRAIAWIKAHGSEYGADPDFIVATGGSAGGHLTALVGLTANDPEYQPGFEQVDTSVRACVPFYGVYDFLDRHHTLPSRELLDLLETRVMKASVQEAPEAYDKASPIARIHTQAPPFFIVHGDCDSLVPVEQARLFTAALRATSGEPVAYAEIPGAQHAFEIFPSLRTVHTVHGVERFLAWAHSRYLAATQGKGENAAAA